MPLWTILTKWPAPASPTHLRVVSVVDGVIHGLDFHDLRHEDGTASQVEIAPEDLQERLTIEGLVKLRRAEVTFARGVSVDTARASLEDALSLSDRLLEAYREAAQQASFTQPDDTPSDETSS